MPEEDLISLLTKVGEDPLSWMPDVEVGGNQSIAQEHFDLEYTSPGKRFRLKSYSLSPQDFCHVIWDNAAIGNGSCMQPFLERKDAIFLSHRTHSLEAAIRWHYKAVSYLEQREQGH